MAAWLPLLLALIGLAAVWLAAWFARDPRPASPGMALHMAIVGIVMLLASLAIYFADGHADWMRWIVIALVVLINLAVVSLLLYLRRIHRQGRPRP